MPTPKKGEKEEEYISRCISMRRSEHPEESNKKSQAVCFSMWRKHKGGKK